MVKSNADLITSKLIMGNGRSHNLISEGHITESVGIEGSISGDIITSTDKHTIKDLKIKSMNFKIPKMTDKESILKQFNGKDKIAADLHVDSVHVDEDGLFDIGSGDNAPNIKLNQRRKNAVKKPSYIKQSKHKNHYENVDVSVELNGADTTNTSPTPTPNIQPVVIENNINVAKDAIEALLGPYKNKLKTERSRWTEWGSWQKCSASCGDGASFRQRFCVKVQQVPCSGHQQEQKICQNLPHCLGHWTNWTVCSVTCGSGIQSRTRGCILGETDKDKCTEHNVQTKMCQMKACPSHTATLSKGWSDWSHWSSCSVTCGQGNEIKTRRCNHGDLEECTGTTSHTRLCISHACNTGQHSIVYDSEGKTTKLKCSYNHNIDVSEVYWVTPNGKRISSYTNSNKFQVQGDYLIIENAEEVNTGVYHCVLVPRHAQNVAQSQALTSDVQLAIVNCASHPCQNHATCLEERSLVRNIHHFICKCREGYTGTLCENYEMKHGGLRTVLIVFILTIVLVLVTIIAWQQYQKRKLQKSHTLGTKPSDDLSGIGGSAIYKKCQVANAPKLKKSKQSNLKKIKNLGGMLLQGHKKVIKTMKKKGKKIIRKVKKEPAVIEEGAVPEDGDGCVEVNTLQGVEGSPYTEQTRIPPVEQVSLSVCGDGYEVSDVSGHQLGQRKDSLIELYGKDGHIIRIAEEEHGHLEEVQRPCRSAHYVRKPDDYSYYEEDSDLLTEIMTELDGPASLDHSDQSVFSEAETNTKNVRSRTSGTKVMMKKSMASQTIPSMLETTRRRQRLFSGIDYPNPETEDIPPGLVPRLMDDYMNAVELYPEKKFSTNVSVQKHQGNNYNKNNSNYRSVLAFSDLNKSLDLHKSHENIKQHNNQGHKNRDYPLDVQITSQYHINYLHKNKGSADYGLQKQSGKVNTFYNQKKQDICQETIFSALSIDFMMKSIARSNENKHTSDGIFMSESNVVNDSQGLVDSQITNITNIHLTNEEAQKCTQGH